MGEGVRGGCSKQSWSSLLILVPCLATIWFLNTLTNGEESMKMPCFLCLFLLHVFASIFEVWFSCRLTELHTRLAEWFSWGEFHADEAVDLNPLHLRRILQIESQNQCCGSGSGTFRLIGSRAGHFSEQINRFKKRLAQTILCLITWLYNAL